MLRKQTTKHNISLTHSIIQESTTESVLESKLTRYREVLSAWSAHGARLRPPCFSIRTINTSKQI